jgi:cytochrome c-type biogenesis protein CcmH
VSGKVPAPMARPPRAAAAAVCAVAILVALAHVAPVSAQATATPVAPAATTAPAPRARPLAADPALEAEVLRIATDLRCLVCQNETIAASNAELAVDLRQQIREQLRAGRTESQIKDYMVERYGDFVLYTPPVKPLTWLLWLGPFGLLAAMLAWYTRLLRRRAKLAPAPLSAAERARAQALLDGTPGGARTPAPETGVRPPMPGSGR